MVAKTEAEFWFVKRPLIEGFLVSSAYLEFTKRLLLPPVEPLLSRIVWVASLAASYSSSSSTRGGDLLPLALLSRLPKRLGELP